MTADKTSFAVSELARSPRVAGAPHPSLRSCLTRRYAGFTDGTEPAGGFVLPATLSTLLVIKLADSALRPPQFIAGGHESYSVIDGKCAPSYVEVWLTPPAAYRILGVPMDQLSGHFVDLRDVLGDESERFGDDLRSATNWETRFDQVDRFLLRKLDDGPPVAPEVAYAWRRIVATSGAVPLPGLAADTGWSHKHLINKFKQYIGVTPKRAARLVRFQQLLKRVDGEREPDWPQIAFEHGYADQAHLIREFHQFAGASPAAFFSSRAVSEA